MNNRFNYILVSKWIIFNYIFKFEENYNSQIFNLKIYFKGGFDNEYYDILYNSCINHR